MAPYKTAHRTTGTSNPKFPVPSACKIQQTYKQPTRADSRRVGDSVPGNDYETRVCYTLHAICKRSSWLSTK